MGLGLGLGMGTVPFLAMLCEESGWVGEGGSGSGGRW